MAGWNNARLEHQLSQGSTDKMRAQTGLHADNTARQHLELLDQRQALDLPSKNEIADRVKTDKVKNIFADIDAN